MFFEMFIMFSISDIKHVFNVFILTTMVKRGVVGGAWLKPFKLPPRAAVSR